MAASGKLWELLGKSVRWDEVLRQAPKIVEVARNLYETNRQRQQRPAEPRGPAAPPAGPDATAALRDRIADLESQVRRLQENEIQQAGLVADMARQLEALAGSVDALLARGRLLLWLGGGALAVGLAALVLSLVR